MYAVTSPNNKLIESCCRNASNEKCLSKPCQSHLPRIAQSILTEFAGPSLVTDAGTGFASTVSATIDAARRLGTVVATPSLRAHAFVQLDTKGALARAVRQALHRVAVHLGAIGTFPAFLAEADAVDAKAVVGARRVRAISFIKRKTPKLST